MIAEYAENIQLILRSLPEEPGVYQYYDEEGNVLYVGKAKNLKKRVSSYFTKEHETARLRLLLRKIRDIKTIVVASESDALFLENNLIKEFQPRYNVNLKDDKTYPWVCIKKENFPRIFSTRNFIKDGSEYFGPYASVKVMYAVLDLIRSLFPLRTCSLNLTKENIEAGKFRTCLEYHIGRCKAPCVNYQSEEEYMEGIRLAKNILRGNFSGVLRDMKNQMQVLSSDLQFEAAQKIKDKIDLLEKYQSRSTLVSSSVKDAEVYSIISDEIKAYVNFLKIKDGAVIQGLTYEIKKKLEEEDEELLLYGIREIREMLRSDTKEVIVPFIPEFNLEGVEFHIPKAGEKKQLLDLSLKNAEQFKKEKEKQSELVDPERHSKRILATMK
ncbi:MAG: excinuclease ABC subunit UvrC, partial [Bacteroidota bacterium]